jgi:hypothetical protein
MQDFSALVETSGSSDLVCFAETRLYCDPRSSTDEGPGSMIDAGYFAKRIVPRPKEIHAPGVREICSVSNCISDGAEGWLESWRHNELGWFNTIDDALGVVPSEMVGRYRLFAYRVAPQIHRGGTRLGASLPHDVHPEPIPPDFVVRGFDAVSRSHDGVVGFECSPLSCNYLAAELEVNEFCLFSSLSAALAGADAFSKEQPEPGDYYVVQVLEAPELAFAEGSAA